MTSGKPVRGMCSVCGRSEGLEAHHPVGRARVPNATVPVCRRCHSEQSERQLEAGVELEARSSNAGEDLWAFAIGFQSLLSASARNGLGGAVDERFENASTGLVREVIRGCPEAQQAGVGADPMTNAVRDARRARRRPRRPSRAARAAEQQTSVEFACFSVSAMISALVVVVGEMLGNESQQAAYVQSLTSITLTPDALAMHLSDLVQHPRLAELVSIMERDRELLCELLEQLAAVQDASAVPLTLMTLGARLRRRETAYLDVFTYLAGAENGVVASVAFERFLDRSEDS